MKDCDKCPFQGCDSTESGCDWYCAAGIPEEFLEGYGCCLKYKEAEKLKRLNDRVLDNIYWGWEFFDGQRFIPYEELSVQDKDRYNKYQKEENENVFEHKKYIDHLAKKYLEKGIE